MLEALNMIKDIKIGKYDMIFFVVVIFIAGLIIGVTFAPQYAYVNYNQPDLHE